MSRRNQPLNPDQLEHALVRPYGQFKQTEDDYRSTSQREFQAPSSETYRREKVTRPQASLGTLSDGLGDSTSDWNTTSAQSYMSPEKGTYVPKKSTVGSTQHHFSLGETATDYNTTSGSTYTKHERSLGSRAPSQMSMTAARASFDVAPPVTAHPSQQRYNILTGKPI